MVKRATHTLQPRAHLMWHALEYFSNNPKFVNRSSAECHCVQTYVGLCTGGVIDVSMIEITKIRFTTTTTITTVIIFDTTAVIITINKNNVHYLLAMIICVFTHVSSATNFL